MLTQFIVPPPASGAMAFVIANGPSLRGVDLTKLPPVLTIGMNAAYRHWDRIGWAPTHYACVDEVVGLHHAEAIGRMIAERTAPAPGAFLLRQNLITELGALGADPRVVNFDALQAVSRQFGRHPVTTGSHALIWAITLGRRNIFLLGADANYVEVVPGAERVTGQVLEIARADENPNYYFDDYQRVGDRYHVPNIGGETHLRSWRTAAAVAAEADAQVYNLSPVSRIDAFDFATLDDVLSGGDIRVTPREAHHLVPYPPLFRHALPTEARAAVS